MLSLFGFAPDGVYLANDIAAVAVGSYPTLSPLLITHSVRHQRFAFCGTFPQTNGNPLTWPGVTRHRVSMEPGLSSTASFQKLQQRSPGRLAKRV